MDGRRYEQEEFPLYRTLRTGERVLSERIELVREAGSRVMVDVSTAPFHGPSGEVSGGVILLQDVTVQEHQERAERDFVTNAAHELQSPLAAIISAIEVLQTGAKDGPQRDVFLGHIEHGSDRLARLVRALLVLARSQTGVEAPRDELVAVCPLLKEIGDGLEVGSGVEIEVDCPEDLAVVTSRELLEQAVLNLAENAAKYTTKGRVVLGAREVGDGSIELSVSDTGAGIPAVERPHVFERFYRSDPNGGAGFGLGLAIVRAAADALDARLELYSVVGAGTVIRMKLPKAATLVSS
jgi:signal transduction histidine kinase